MDPPVKAITGWGWKPGPDEFGPDVLVFDPPGDVTRLTSTPHLAVEVLPSDRAADTIRKFAKYAAAGLERYWIIDPEGPVIVEYRLEEGTFREISRHEAGSLATLDVGPATLAIDPADPLG